MDAYITGADRGLGRALTERFLLEGFTVFAGRYGLEHRFLADLKDQFGGKLHIIDLDISSDSSVETAAEYIRRHTCQLDILINNGAIIGDRSTIMEKLDFDDMLYVYSVNAVGPLRVSQSVLDLLLKGQMKRIINISSEAGSMTARLKRRQNNRYAYCGSKAALNVQSILLQNHLQEYGIKLYLIEPGWMKTYMSGKKSEQANVEPEETAAELWKFLQRQDQPDYMFHDLFENKPFSW